MSVTRDPPELNGTQGVRPHDFVTWMVLAGLIASHILFFIVPVFLNDSGRMLFMRSVPTLQKRNSIGEDARSMQVIVSAWRGGVDPYAVEAISNDIAYPPLTILLFSPMAFLDPSTSYRAILALTVAAYILGNLLLPARIVGRITPLVALFFIVGLASYGLQFELERGQFNVIAVSLAVTGVFLFHTYPDRKVLQYLAMGLFTIAVQLKIYPAIFVLLLVRDWRDWRSNAGRFAALAAINLGLLASLGNEGITSFRAALTRSIGTPPGEKINHSIASFVQSVYDSRNLGWIAAPPPAGATSGVEGAVLQILLLVAVVGCLAVAVRLAMLRPPNQGISGQLLLTCALCALLVPTRSYDYTLAVLPGPMAMFMQQIAAESDRWLIRGRLARAGIGGLILATAVAYGMTQYSFTNKADVLALQSNFPALISILILAQILAVLSERSGRRQEREPAIQH